MRSKLLILTFLFLFFGVRPVIASSVVINEIMYNLKDSDSKREWVELLNEDTDVDLTNWKLEEGGTQHALTLKQGNSVVSSEQYAVIVDDYTQFLQDHPGFSGTVFDSSFSLSNTGENIKLRDTANGNVIDEVNYTSALGAAGDGNSLQRKPDGSWIAAFPTPSSQNTNDPPSPTPTLTPTPTPTPSPTPTPTPPRTPSPTAIPKKTVTPTNTSFSTSIPLTSAAPIKTYDRLVYHIASVAGVTKIVSQSAIPSSNIKVASQKQNNPILILGIIFIATGITISAYLVLKNKAKYNL